MRAWTAAVLLAGAACAGRALAPPAPAEPVAKEVPAPARRADPAEVKRLYEEALDAYAKEDLAGSERLFRLMLSLDPGNAAALKGLRRLTSEKPPP